MNVKSILFLMLIFLIINGCITIQVSSDNSKESQDSEQLSTFDLADVGKKVNYKAATDINFQIINGADLLNAKAASKKTWIYLWGSWCKPCIEKMPTMMEIARKNKDLNILFVSEDYRISGLQKILFENNFDGIPYILDADTYGTRTKEKSKKLHAEIFSELEFIPGFPKNYIYNSKKEAKLFKIGLIEQDELKRLGIKL